MSYLFGVVLPVVGRGGPGLPAVSMVAVRSVALQVELHLRQGVHLLEGLSLLLFCKLLHGQEPETEV